MEWQLAQGDDLDAMIAQAEAGKPAAIRALLSAPQISEFEQLYWNAYGLLGTDRPVSMAGLSPIPYKSMLTYCNHHGFTYSETERFVAVIRAMDQANIAYHAKQAKRKSK